MKEIVDQSVKEIAQQVHDYQVGSVPRMRRTTFEEIVELTVKRCNESLEEEYRRPRQLVPIKPFQVPFRLGPPPQPRYESRQLLIPDELSPEPQNAPVLPPKLTTKLPQP